MKFYILIIIIAISFMGCMPVAKIIYGVKKPKQKSYGQIENYAMKNELNHFSHYTITQSAFIRFFDQSVSLFNRNSINQIIVFNEKGNLLVLKDTISCSGDMIKYVESIGLEDKFNVIDSISINDIFGDTIINISQPESYFVPVKDKTTIVLTWATYVGRLNKNTTKVWADSLSNNGIRNDEQVIFMSFDINELWNSDMKSKWE